MEKFLPLILVNADEVIYAHDPRICEWLLLLQESIDSTLCTLLSKINRVRVTNEGHGRKTLHPRLVVYLEMIPDVLNYL